MLKVRKPRRAASHDGGVFVSLCDGSVRFIPDTIDHGVSYEQLHAFTRPRCYRLGKTHRLLRRRHPDRGRARRPGLSFPASFVVCIPRVALGSLAGGKLLHFASRNCTMAGRSLLTLSVVLTAMGCGQSKPETFSVTGTVSWHGAPVEQAALMFMPLDPAVPPQAVDAKAGHFALRMRPGRKKVQIFARCTVPSNADPTTVAALRDSHLPPPYNVHAVLEVEIEPHDDNRLTFDLPNRTLMGRRAAPSPKVSVPCG